MTNRRRRAWLYGSALVVAAGLLFLGFGITVPPDEGTRLSGAALLANLGDYDQALAACDQALEEHPDSLKARIYRATFLSMAGRSDEAVAAYDDALARAGGDPEMKRSLRLDRAGALFAAGRIEESEAEARAFRAEGALFEAYTLEGHLAQRRGRLPEAVHAFREASRLRPDDVQARARLWRALMRQGEADLAARRFEAALAAFEEAGPLFEREGRPWARAAEVQLARDKPEAAVALLRKAGRRTPGVAPLLFRAATALLQAGRTERAYEVLEGAWGADARATLALIEAERAWDAHRDAPRLKAFLETMRSGKEGGLTASE